MIFRARRITAVEGLETRLFLEVVAPEALIDRSMEIAKEIAANGPIALAQAKYVINKGLEVSLPMGLAIESNAYAATIPTRDRTEGLTFVKPAEGVELNVELINKMEKNRLLGQISLSHFQKVNRVRLLSDSSCLTS